MQENFLNIAAQTTSEDPRLAEKMLGSIYSNSQLQSLLAEAGASENQEQLQIQSFGSLLAGKPTGNKETINGKIVISSLCPYIDIPEGDYPTNDEILKVSSPPEICDIMEPNRIANMQRWLNLYHKYPDKFSKLMKEIPEDKYEVELPLDIDENPWYNMIRSDMLFYLEEIYSELSTRKFNINKLYITSAYRDPRYNAKYGNIDYDAHVIGCAVDICSTPLIIQEISNISESLNIPGIGRSATMIHLDLCGRARWTYNE